MGDDEEAIEYAKGERRHSEEIHCGDGLAVIAQECRPSLCRFGFRGALRIQRSTVRSEISKPSIFSSPWMRGAPQVGFSVTMRKMRSRNSLLVRTFFLHERRCREIHFQYSLNPARCQRTTVSGWTIRSVCFHPGQNRRRMTQNSRSGTVKSRPRMPMCQHGKLLPQGQVFEEEITAGSEETRG